MKYIFFCKSEVLLSEYFSTDSFSKPKCYPVLTLVFIDVLEYCLRLYEKSEGTPCPHAMLTPQIRVVTVLLLWNHLNSLSFLVLWAEPTGLQSVTLELLASGLLHCSHLTLKQQECGKGEVRWDETIISIFKPFTTKMNMFFSSFLFPLQIIANYPLDLISNNELHTPKK